MNTLTITPSFDGTVTIPDAAIEQRDEFLTVAKGIATVANPDELQLAVNALKDLAGLEKITEAGRKKEKQPFLDFCRLIDSFAAKFIAPVEAEKDRVTSLVNAYQRAEFERKRKEEIRLADEARKAQEEAWKAAAEIKRQEEELARKKAELEKMELSKKQRAEAERQQKEAQEKLLAAQLKAEEAALTQQSVETQLSAPTNTPRGLATRVRYDFEIVKPEVCVREMGAFILWKPGEEVWKFDRAGFLKSLNQEGSGNVSPFLPPEGQQSVVNPRVGIRVFRDVSSHVR